MMWGYGFSWLSMTLMVLGSTLWIVLLIALIWAMLRWLNHRAASPVLQTKTLPESGPTAIAILSQRYARGEIDATTFEQMLGIYLTSILGMAKKVTPDLALLLGRPPRTVRDFARDYRTQLLLDVPTQVKILL